MKKIGFKSIGVFAVSVLTIALTSCGGSSGGGEDDFEFESRDLMNKYWFANPYLSSSYSNDDAVIVYKFEGGGVLKRQQYSGRRDEAVGSWNLNDNILEIHDESISEDDLQEWFIQSKSTANYLNLKRTGGSRDFYTNISGFDDVTADAYLVNELKLVDNEYVSSYRFDYLVSGNAISKVYAMLDNDTRNTLEERQDVYGDKIFTLSDDDMDNYISDFGGEQLVRFDLELDGGEKVKLDENIYADNIASFSSADRDYSRDGLSITVNWKAIDEENVYYFIEILDEKSSTGIPLFKSNRQPAVANEAKSLKISSGISAEIDELDKLNIDEEYLVRITGLKYETGIDPINSSNKDVNIQAKTILTYKIIW
ncbi:hypothetical protein [Ancylomarina sp. 16SWW S1-10-2]|uniref:hypothetical protein n=1 Tax=Ancylomarina sp. 16SWW S1-10-2 TaxID=2499681 RepID=UPI0012AD9C10|nr:hypothetical protein [Ancylomarina sp. 16SWW S1-10-2]MRT91424.1 hypothetical protein [Ancylomarina sp. 16SWW S1-10-2]